jgi:glycosyltransferase involved in cell wall biosynthesis
VFTEIVERTGGGVLTVPGDTADWVRAVLDLWQNVDRRKRLGAAAYDGVRDQYAVSLAVEHLMGVYRALDGLAAG